MRVGLDTGVPVLSVSLTPHQFQETPHHLAIYKAHFVTKGEEAASAALGHPVRPPRLARRRRLRHLVLASPHRARIARGLVHESPYP